MGAVETIATAKRLARLAAAELYVRSPGFLQSLRGKVVILMYHRVVTAAELSRQFIQPGMYVTAGTFERQVRFLREHFSVVSLSELLGMWQRREWHPERRYAVVTFDDGWRDNYVHAFPILRKWDVSATIFLPTGFVGTMKWFWPERVGWLLQRLLEAPADQQARVCEVMRKRFGWFGDIAKTMMDGRSEEAIEFCKTLTAETVGEWSREMTDELAVRMPTERLVMTWEEIREMSAAKISFGSHSVNHKILTNVSDAELHEEVHGSLETLRQQGLHGEVVFCYPNGNYSSAVARCVESAGYCAATTTDPGWEGQEASHLFRLRRVEVHNDLTDTDSLFAFHLAGYNNAFRGWRTATQSTVALSL